MAPLLTNGSARSKFLGILLAYICYFFFYLKNWIMGIYYCLCNIECVYVIYVFQAVVREYTGNGADLNGCIEQYV